MASARKMVTSGSLSKLPQTVHQVDAGEVTKESEPTIPNRANRGCGTPLLTRPDNSTVLDSIDFVLTPNQPNLLFNQDFGTKTLDNEYETYV